MFIEGDVKQIIDRPETEKHKTAGQPAERLRGKIMMNERITFTLNNAEYLDTCNGRFYRTENGKKVRISKAEYEVAWEAYTDSLRTEDIEDETIDEQPEIKEDMACIKNAEGEVVSEIFETPGQAYETALEKGLADEDGYYIATGSFDTKWDHFETQDIQTAPSKKEIEARIAEKASEKPEKAHKDAKVQKDSKKSTGTKKAKEKAPKTKKVPEGGAQFEIDDLKIILTAKQVDFIKHLPDTDFWENGIDSKIWVDCLCDDIKGQFEGKPMTVGAMISTLCEKGLGLRAKEKINNHKTTSFCLTELGKQVAQKLGLN